MPHFFILLFLLACCFPGFSQKADFSWEPMQKRIDSLKGLLPAAHGKERISLLNELGDAYRDFNKDSAQAILGQAYNEASVIHDAREMSRSLSLLARMQINLKEAKSLAVQAVQWAEKSRDEETLAYAYCALGSIHQILNEFPDALKALDKAEAILKKLKMNHGLSLVYLFKGNIYVKMRRMNDGLNYLNQSARMAKKPDQQGNRGSLYTDALCGIGEIYSSMKEYPTALSYFRQCMDSRELTRIFPPWTMYHKTGSVYLSTGVYDSAIYYYDRSIAVINSFLKDPEAIKANSAASYMKKGEAYIGLKRYDTALQLLLPELDYFRKTNNTVWLVDILHKTGTAYAGKKQYARALQYGREQMALARENHVLSGSQNAFDLLAAVFENQNRPDSAFYYLKLASAMKDSMAKENLKSNVTFYKAMTENEAAEAKIELLNKDNQIKQQRLNILIGGLLGLLLVGAIGFRYIALKRKNEAHRHALLENELQIQKLESEKKQAGLQQHATELEMQALRSQMNPHFIFNCLNAINHFVLKNETETASDYLTRFSRLIRMVLQNSSRKSIPLSDELDMLKLYIELERVRFKNRFHYSINVGSEVDSESVQIPPLLLQPFVENAIWHGLMHKEGNGELTIDVATRNGMLCCTVTDNGVGRQDRADAGNHSPMQKKSLGMQITASRLKLLDEEKGNSTLSIIDLKDLDNKAGGTKVIIQIPVREQEISMA